VEVAANLEFPGPRTRFLRTKKIPVGLYRTEFLYLERQAPPDEIAQFRFYDRIAERLPNHTSLFRTFDLGSDKIRNGDRPNVERQSGPRLGEVFG